MIDAVFSVVEPTPGRYQAHADATWFQGRGAYGGLPAAWLVAAGQHVLGRPHRRVRTLAVHLAAPIPDRPVAIHVAVVREGTHISQLRGEIRDGDAVLATMLGTWGAARDSVSPRPGPAPPPMPDPHSLPRMPALPDLPAFARHHIDYRFVHGGLPGTGRPPRLGGWARFAAGASPSDPMLAALSDVWPPAILPALDKLRPAATVDLTLHFHEAPLDTATPHDFYAYDARITQVCDGYAEEQAHLWDAAGRRLLSIRQSIVVFG